MVEITGKDLHDFLKTADLVVLHPYSGGEPAIVDYHGMERASDEDEVTELVLGVEAWSQDFSIGADEAVQVLAGGRFTFRGFAGILIAYRRHPYSPYTEA